MAQLVDMKRTAADRKKAEKQATAPYPEQEDYPWGLKVTLGPEEIEKLGNPSFDPEEGGMLLAEFVVCQERIETVDGQTKRYATLDLRRMAITPKAPKVDPAQKLYGSE